LSSFYLDWIAVLDQSNDPRGMVTGFVTSLEYAVVSGMALTPPFVRSFFGGGRCLAD
jgi:hypothetical protein